MDGWLASSHEVQHHTGLTPHGHLSCPVPLRAAILGAGTKENIPSQPKYLCSCSWRFSSWGKVMLSVHLPQFPRNMERIFGCHQWIHYLAEQSHMNEILENQLSFTDPSMQQHCPCELHPTCCFMPAFMVKVGVPCLWENLGLFSKEEQGKGLGAWESTFQSILQWLWLGSALSACFWEWGIAARKPTSSSHFHEFQMHWQLTSGLETASQEGEYIGLFSAHVSLLGFHFLDPPSSLSWGAEAVCIKKGGFLREKTAWQS